MKKNRTMRLAAMLLVLVLMTSCFVGGTFAKYTSSASNTDTARVAKWSIIYTDKTNTGAAGVDIAEEDEVVFDLFNTTYAENETNVKTGDNETIIAPGTSGSFTFDIKNESEVTATFKLVLSESKTDSNLPIEYSFNGTDYYDDFTEINAEYNDNATHTLGFTGTTNKEVTIYWRWAFEGKDSANYTTTQTDGTDTTLGINAQTSPASVTITATISATQVD